VPLIAAMVKALTDEIMVRTGAAHFDLDPAQAAARCREFLARGVYAVFLAVDADTHKISGFAALCESHALYAQGAFGIIQEFYVEPASRSRGLGRQLLEALAAHARQRGWKRLELCTPPLPEFERSLDFYADHGFEVTGGRKMRRLL
jgi:GNAT superfamily N-acetyltransferase